MSKPVFVVLIPLNEDGVSQSVYAHSLQTLTPFEYWFVKYFQKNDSGYLFGSIEQLIKQYGCRPISESADKELLADISKHVSDKNLFPFEVNKSSFSEWLEFESEKLASFTESNHCIIIVRMNWN